MLLNVTRKGNPMSNCHHIDWDNLQIVVGTLRGQTNPTYHCLLCDKEVSPEDYKETLKQIKKHKEDNTLKFYRTPNGDVHTEEECVDKKKCDIHEED